MILFDHIDSIALLLLILCKLISFKEEIIQMIPNIFSRLNFDDFSLFCWSIQTFLIAFDCFSSCCIMDRNWDDFNEVVSLCIDWFEEWEDFSIVEFN
jgi:hypothetical protein